MVVHEWRCCGCYRRPYRWRRLWHRRLRRVGVLLLWEPRVCFCRARDVISRWRVSVSIFWEYFLAGRWNRRLCRRCTVAWLTVRRGLRHVWCVVMPIWQYIRPPLAQLAIETRLLVNPVVCIVAKIAIAII